MGENGFHWEPGPFLKSNDPADQYVIVDAIKLEEQYS